MAISNGIFKGNINEKTIQDYSYKLDYSIEDLEKRIECVELVLNLDHIGSKDEFWQEVWDMASCKTDLNKDDALWTDTNICGILESMGTYLIARDEKEEADEKKRFSRPRKEVEMNKEFSTENYESVKNDKNYRLAPSESIKESDYRLREVFSKDYDYYIDVVYPKYINKLKSKISADLENRYGYHDGSYDDFSCGSIISEEKWENLKRLEIEKIKLLKDARENLNELKKQNKMIQNGSIYNRPYRSDIKREDIEVYKYDFINRITPCHVQLSKSGYNNDVIKKIEEKSLYKKKRRSLGVSLRHIMNNISDINEYMISCKLAYSNRICITPDKNGANMSILDHVDYSNQKHVESILYIQDNGINYENDMSIVAYDLNKAIRYAKAEKIIDEKDIHILEGIRHRITQDKLANELGVSKQAVNKRISKISNKISCILK